jgi:hypothetical protein
MSDDNIVYLPVTPRGLACLRDAITEARGRSLEDRCDIVGGYDWDTAARHGKRADHEMQEYWARRYRSERAWRRRREAQEKPDPQGAA